MFFELVDDRFAAGLEASALGPLLKLVVLLCIPVGLANPGNRLNPGYLL